MARSMSSALATDCSSMRMACSPMATPSLEVAKPGMARTGIGDLFLLHSLAQQGLDSAPRRIERRRIRIVNDRLVAGQCGQIGDSAAHRSGADDRDLANHRRGVYRTG